jgi:putative hydroxymethylpyrimidine transport system ATP-binding protein
VALQCNHIGFLFQEDRLLPWLNCTENVALHSRLHASKGAHRQQKEKAAAMLEAVGLRDHMHKKPAALSGGMKQRVALARTLMTDAPIIFMDEPFSALDTTTRWSLQDLAMKIFQDKTVCLITHDPLEAVRLAHNIHIMHRPISAQSQPHMAVQTTAFSPPTTPPPRAAQDAATLAASAALITAQHAINNTPIAGGTASCHQL